MNEKVHENISYEVEVEITQQPKNKPKEGKKICCAKCEATNLHLSIKRPMSKLPYCLSWMLGCGIVIFIVFLATNARISVNEAIIGSVFLGVVFGLVIGLILYPSISYDYLCLECSHKGRIR